MTEHGGGAVLGRPRRHGCTTTRNVTRDRGLAGQVPGPGGERDTVPTMRSPEDTLEIQAVVVRYGFMIDDRDWDALDQIFTEDAVVDYRLNDPPTGVGPIVGRDELLHQLRDVLSHPYQHMLVSHVIDDVSDDEVVVRSKALLPIPGDRIADILYRDEVVRTPDGWRIKNKTIKSYHPS